MPAPEHRFESLRERLLIGGIAPRHVRRTLTELRDHFDDAVRDGEAAGMSAARAAEAAWARLGSEDAITMSVLARPELRALTARYPRTIFGAGPLVLWIFAIFATVFVFIHLTSALQGMGVLPPPNTRADPAWFRATFIALLFLYVRILPLVLGAVLLILAARQRLSLHWPLAGAALISLVSGTTDFAVKFADVAGQKGELTIGNKLALMMPGLPDAFIPRDGSASGGLAVAVLNIVLILLAYWT